MFILLNNRMYLILVLAILFIILWILIKKQNSRENFYPAWQDHMLYGELSRRLKVGVWRGWLNINYLLLTNELLNYTNIDVVLFESATELIENLLVKKEIDIAITTEASYGIYISNKIQDMTTDKAFNKEYILQNKQKILQNFTTRRIFTAFNIYRFLLADNLGVNKPSDIKNKVIEITNLTNSLYGLDLDILGDIKYTKIYSEVDKGISKYDSTNKLGYQIDAYFTQFNHPNETLKEISQKINCTIIDLYSDNNLDKTNPFVKPEVILNKYFYLKKGKMDLESYPEIKARRAQSIRYNNLPYSENYVNCYTYKMIMLTREDVNDEWIYLFTKNFVDNFEAIKNSVYYLRDIKLDEMYKSSLSDILPMHRAVYKK
jgi:TRAP-type uncharacterized transport system substrate-binding protein